MNGRIKERLPEPHRVVFKPPAIFVRFPRPGLGARTMRLRDLAAACALITFTFPLMAIVAMAIKCDSPVPVFVRQRRVGSGGRHFDVLKFRTSLQAVENPELTCYRTSQMTRMGPYLRYTRVDALPQL